MLRPGQTLALAGPEARHYNHPATRPPSRPRPQQMFILAVTLPFLNGFSWNFAWLLFRWQGWSLQTKHRPCSTAESLNTLWPIFQPFLNRLSWNFASLLFRWKGSSLDLKQWPCSFSVQCSAAESSSQPFFNQLVTPVVAYSNCSDFFSNSSVKTTKVFKLQQDGFVSHCQHFSQLSWFFGNPPWW